MDVRCLQAYKHHMHVLEGHSYKTPSTSVFDSERIAEEKVMIEGHYSHHMSRLAAFVKVTYQSDRNKGKDNTYNNFEP